MEEPEVFGDPEYKIFDVILPEALEEAINPPPTIKLVNFPKTTEYFGGFRSNEFTILCGATGRGKTTLLANWSADLISQNIPHFVASIETGHNDFARRVMSVFTKEDLNFGENISRERLSRQLNEHRKNLFNQTCFLSLYDNRFSVKRLIHDIQWFVENKGIKVAFIDNLNFFLDVTSANNQIVEMDRVIHELIMFCKRCDVHVVMVMHPRKTENGRVESEFDIKGSSTAVQESQNVILFNEPDEKTRIDRGLVFGTRELWFKKMRRRGKFVGSKVWIKPHPVTYEEVFFHDKSPTGT